jgi:acyl-CoA synthetase (AMP-forming)/AMP-acid ligase II
MPSFLNVAAHLPAAAQSRPDALALVDQRSTAWSNQRLNAECDRLAHELQAFGIRRGMRTALMVPPSLEFFALTFALFKIGAVLVLIDPGMGVRNLGECLAEAEPEAFIGIRKAHIARKLLGWAKKTVKITAGVNTRLFCQSGVRFNSKFEIQVSLFPTADVADDEMASILFTSGSTGPAKGAVYTHGIFAAQVEALRKLFDIQPGEIDLCTFPLFALFAPALGMTAIIPDMDATRPAKVDPAKIFAAVGRWECTNMFGSPALLNALARKNPHPLPLSRKAGRGEQESSAGASPSPEASPSMQTLKRVISAGAPVPATTIERITQMLAPGTPVFTPYGATECLPVACNDSATILGETRQKTDAGAGICVGFPVPEIDVAIIPVSDEPIARWTDALRQPTDVIGEITVHGPFVSPAYFNRPEATKLAKIADGAGGVWHRMGDLGTFDERGRLWFCGRKAHRVWTADGPVDTIPCEAIFNTHPAVFRSALVGVGARGQQTPVLCVELERSQSGIDRAKLTEELLATGARYEHTRGISTVLYHPAFPVDIRHNAKIFREKLAVWAAKRMKQ